MSFSRDILRKTHTADNPGLLDIKQKWDRTGLDMTDLLAHSARDPSLTMAFNYASLLLNNSFFLESLHGAESPKDVPIRFQPLAERVEAFAEGIVGGGWLWVRNTILDDPMLVLN